MTTHSSIVACGVGLVVGVSCASGQSDGREAGGAAEATEAEAAPERADLRVVVRGGARFHFDADLDRGDVSVARVNGGADFIIPLTDRVELLLSPDAEFSFYDFGTDSTGSSLVRGVGEIIDDAYRQRYEARLTAKVDDRWTVAVGGNLTWSAEFDADTSDGLTGGGYVAAHYGFSPTLVVGAGLTAQSRLEDNARVFPFPVFEWRFAERWQLAGRGTGGQLSFTPTDAWTLFFRGGWEPREFRLRDDGPVPEGVLRDERIVLDVGAVYRPRPAIEVSATVGATVWNEYNVLDSGGSSVGKSDADPHVNAGVSVVLKF